MSGGLPHFDVRPLRAATGNSCLHRSWVYFFATSFHQIKASLPFKIPGMAKHNYIFNEVFINLDILFRRKKHRSSQSNIKRDTNGYHHHLLGKLDCYRFAYIFNLFIIVNPLCRK